MNFYDIVCKYVEYDTMDKRIEILVNCKILEVKEE